MQSNQQLNDEEEEKMRGGAGWEDDESLEEIETPVEQSTEVLEELNRSISANEQVSDAVPNSSQQVHCRQLNMIQAPVIEDIGQGIISQNEAAEVEVKEEALPVEPEV